MKPINIKMHTCQEKIPRECWWVWVHQTEVRQESSHVVEVFIHAFATDTGLYGS